MIDLVNNIKSKPLRFPREINNVSEVTENVLRRMLTVDPGKRIEWEDLFHHEINSYLEEQLKKDLESTMKQTEDLELNASKFYLKANMVVDHPKEIEKKEEINNYAYDVVNKKKQGQFEGNAIKRDGQRKKSVDRLKETVRTQDTRAEEKSEKEILGDEETLREKQIKAFKRNSKYLLHRRNIYVFLASVAEEAMELGKELKFSDIVGYFLIRKLLQLLGGLKELMEKKDVPGLHYWELFKAEKDFRDIQAYVWKEYDVFRVFYESVHNRIRDKVKYLDEETRTVIANPSSPLSDKVFSRNIREYVKGLYQVVRGRQFKSDSDERKLHVHLQRMADCLNIEGVFQFDRNGVIFNFHSYYEEPMRHDMDRLRKEVAKRVEAL